MATADPPADPPTDPPEDDDTAVQAKFNQLFDNAMTAWVEKNKPAPKKTSQSGGFDLMGSLFGGSKS